MYFNSSVLVAALLAVTQAQTPSGFKPEVKTKLNVMFNSTAVSTPGQMLTKAETASQPAIALDAKSVNATGMYVFVMMDLDVAGSGNNKTRQVLLHAMNTGFKASSQKMAGGATLLTSTDKGPAAYIAPGPPSTDTMPHRYVEMIFAQPADLSVKATDFADMSTRLNFDINAFATKNKLGTPLAANFFMVDGKATAATTPSRSGSAGMPKSTTTPFTGAAGALDMSLGLAGVLGGLVIVAFQTML